MNLRDLKQVHKAPRRLSDEVQGEDPMASVRLRNEEHTGH